jgi:hypothetical protein
LFPLVNTDTQLAQLVDVLDAELERITALRHRFVVLASLVAADQGDWVPDSVRDLQRASEDLRAMELRRAALTSGIATRCGLDDEARLEEIVGSVDPAWGSVLDTRRQALREEIAHLRSEADITRAAVERRSALAEEALSFLHSDVASTYGRPRGTRAQIVQGAL